MKARGSRLNIVLLGKCNTGKSSIFNLILAQKSAIISNVAGTTTDAFKIAFELPKIGAVDFFDTAGFDDETELGQLRKASTEKALKRANIAILICDERGITELEKEYIAKLKSLNINTLIIFNKQDISKTNEFSKKFCKDQKLKYIEISAISAKKELIYEALYELSPKASQKRIMSDLLVENSIVILVTPIDDSAPVGRLILPQVQSLRELLDFHHITIVVQTEELQQCLDALKNKPDLIVCDSQAVNLVNEIITDDIKLTTFSILFSRLKGELEDFIKGSEHLEQLKNNDKILVAEACLHNPEHDDIARIKIPKLIKAYTKKDFDYTFCAGTDFPEDVSSFALIIHCGACMLTSNEMMYRQRLAKSQNTSITNFGMAISKTQNILNRVIKDIISNEP